MPAAASLRQLLSRSIDYAGMFPPCSLELEPALRNQAEYARSSDAWMLGAFVLPVAQFRAAREHLGLFDPEHPLKVSALGPKEVKAGEFLLVLEETVNAIDSFAKSNVDLIAMTQAEFVLPPETDAATLDQAREIIGDLAVFWESPPEAAPRTVEVLAEHNSNTNGRPFGFKLRTGGVVAEAFPSSAQIARALIAPLRHQVPIKFTAGLHHPLRQFRNEVKTKMHGFLNVLGAAVLAAEHQWDEKQTTAMLEDENVGSFVFTADSFGWRDWTIGLERLAARRRFVISFGSCSFNEPREDLRALQLL